MKPELLWMYVIVTILVFLFSLGILIYTLIKKQETPDSELFKIGLTNYENTLLFLDAGDEYQFISFDEDVLENQDVYIVFGSGLKNGSYIYIVNTGKSRKYITSTCVNNNKVQNGNSSKCSANYSPYYYFTDLKTPFTSKILEENKVYKVIINNSDSNRSLLLTNYSIY